MRFTACLLGLWLLAPGWAWAGANPTRPTFSDNANPMDPGYLELEIGGHFWEHDQLSTPFLLKLGLADPVEFKLGGDGFRYNGSIEEGGFGNMILTGKFRFVRQHRMRPSMAFLVNVILPTASDDLGEQTTDLHLLLAATGEFGPMAWDFNAGFRMLGLDKDGDFPLYDIPVILALSARLVGPLGVIMEVADYLPLTDQDNLFHLLGAVTFTLSPRLILDAAFVKGFDAAPDWEVHFGLTATLARLW